MKNGWIYTVFCICFSNFFQCLQSFFFGGGGGEIFTLTISFSRGYRKEIAVQYQTFGLLFMLIRDQTNTNIVFDWSLISTSYRPNIWLENFQLSVIQGHFYIPELKQTSDICTLLTSEKSNFISAIFFGLTSLSEVSFWLKALRLW